MLRHLHTHNICSNSTQYRLRLKTKLYCNTQYITNICRLRHAQAEIVDYYYLVNAVVTVGVP